MITAEELAADQAIRHGFFTREGGVSSGEYSSLNCGYGSGDDKKVVRRNRAIVAEGLAVAPDRLMTCWQWHSPDVHIAKEAWDVLQPPKADAIVTDVPDLAIGVLTADCTPVLFADHSARVIGAAHAGWQGALQGVTDSTLAAMEQLGARRANIIAVIGPTISQSSYETGPEFRPRFVEQDQGNARFFKPSVKPDHFMFDLPGYVAQRLRSSGAGRVVDLALCTYSNEDRFFSFRRTTHRRQKDYGRQIAAITLKQ